MLGFYLNLSFKQVRAPLTTNLSVFRPTNIVGKQRSWPLHLQTPAVCYKHVHMDVTSRMCSTSCKGLASACRLEWHACLQFDATLVLASQRLHHAHIHMTSPTILFLDDNQGSCPSCGVWVPRGLIVLGDSAYSISMSVLFQMISMKANTKKNTVLI